MIPLYPRQSQPEDWRSALKQAFTSPAELLSELGLPGEIACSAAGKAFSFRVPRAFARRIKPCDPADPLLRQVLPVPSEETEEPGFIDDPVGDLQSRRSPGCLHKYHGRVLLIATGACAVQCRYCFRRHFPYSEETALRHQWQQAIHYISEHEEITEVILSGGDPLLLATDQLELLTGEIQKLTHIRRLRIHTRIPVVLPERINSRLLDWLGRMELQKVLVIHCNHANELDHSTDRVLAQLKSQNVTLLNQSVLLRGVNDEAESQIALSERLFQSAVLPYYLHRLDPVRGATHFSVGVRDAGIMMDEVRRRLPGYLVPRLVSEKSGMPYKIPVL